MSWLWWWFCVLRALHICDYSSKGKHSSLLHRCALHGTSNQFVFIVLSKLPLVFHIEMMLQSLYVFLIHIPENYLEFVKLVKTLETKCQNLFKNVKTHWIFLCSPYVPFKCQWVLKFPMCSPKVFQVTPCFNPIYFAQSRKWVYQLLSHMPWKMVSSFHLYRWAKGEELYTSK